MPHPPYDLLPTLDELAVLLGDAVQRRAWLNAYLYAVGINQVSEDYLHRDVLFLGEIADRLLSSAGRAQAVAGRAAAVALSVPQTARSRRNASRQALGGLQDLATLVGVLAQAAVAGGAGAKSDVLRVEETTEAALSSISALPAECRERIPRLPSCFQAFDLDLPDVAALAAGFAQAWPDRSRPLLLAGVRTSGSYLAPLCAAFLEAAGYEDVSTFTLRPQHPLFRSERELIRRNAQRGGLTLVIDDPPGSGRSVARAAEEVARLGVPPESIVLLLPLFGGRDALPALLRRYPSVLLPSDEWVIDSKLAPESVRGVLGELLGPAASVEAVDLIPQAARRWERSHARRLFRAQVVEDGSARSVSVMVEGVGIGYYGEQALAVADTLPGYVPEIFGLREGCLYRAWLPDTSAVCAPGAVPGDELVDAVADYVAERKRALSVDQDRSVGAVGERPVWEVASLVLSRAFGQGAQVSRPLLVDELVKHLLRVASPSVVDGSTALANWFTDARKPGRYLKVDFAKRSFWNLGLGCYDAAFDLAGAAVSAPDGATGDRLRAAYAARGGGSIDEERWLLYELAHHWGRGRTRPGERAALQLASARSLQRYMARLYLSDLERAPDGPLCALDIDGVLETETLGFPATTTSGAMALRALIAHGYCPVLVSGRSAGEVADRCGAYGLAGGVAEYGAVLYTAASGQFEGLLPDADRGLLERIRVSLADFEEAQLDEGYRHAVRAFTEDAHGRRRPLPQAIVDSVVTASGDPARIRAIAGDSQTDFVAGVDKGVGVRTLAERLGRGDRGTPVLALAVGDTAADLPMFREAELALAPAHAGEAVRSAGVGVMEAPYQPGLALAVGRLLGHEPGDCPACRPPLLSADAELLVALLSVGERGRIDHARRFLQLRRRVRATAGRA